MGSLGARFGRAALAALIAVAALAAAAGTAAAGTLSGEVTTVLDDADPRPAPGALVVARDPFSGRAIRTTTVDVDGRYTMAVAAGVYDVTAEQSGWRTDVAEDVDLTADVTHDVTLVQPGNVLWHGRMLEADGRPIEGMRIQLAPLVAVTDSQGRFALPLPQGATRDLAVWSDDLVRNWTFWSYGLTADADRSIELVAPRPVELVVTVVGPDDEPVPDASVISGGLRAAMSMGGFAGTLVSSPTDPRGRTDASGVARVRVYPGMVPAYPESRLTVNPASDYALTTVDLPTIGEEGGSVTVTVEPAQRYRIEGTIRDAAGNPIPGVSIERSYDGPTDANGRFVIGGITPDARRSIEAWGDSWMFDSGPVAVTGNLRLSLRLPPPATLTVRVLGAGDAPVEGVSVTTPSFRLWTDLGGDVPGTRLISGGQELVTDRAGEVHVASFVGASQIELSSGTVSGPDGPVSFSVPELDGDRTVVVRLGRAPPPIAFGASPAPVADDEWWNVSRVALTVTATDETDGVAFVACNVDGVPRAVTFTGGPLTRTGTLFVTGEGRHVVDCASIDGHGEASSASRAVHVDLHSPLPPTATADRPADVGANWFRDTVTVSFTSSGDRLLADGSDGSGIAGTTEPQTFSESGTFVAAGTATDRVGFTSAVRRFNVRVDADPPTTSLVCPVQARLGVRATARWTDADGESGLAATALGSVVLDTSVLGIAVARHTAVDRVGHTAESSCTTTVVP
jgi:hypothetical protein